MQTAWLCAFWILLFLPETVGAVDAPLIEPAAAISGTLIIHGGGEISDKVLDLFVKLAGRANSRVLVFSAKNGASANGGADVIGLLKARGVSSATLMSDAKMVDENAVTDALKTASGIWLCGETPAGFKPICDSVKMKAALFDVLARDGVIAGTSGGGAAMAQVAIRGDSEAGTEYDGLCLLPGIGICPHFLTADKSSRIMDALAKHPGLAGLGIDDGMTLVVHGREMYVHGESTVTRCLTPSANRPALKDAYKDGGIIDLTALTRAAIARAGPVYPPTLPVSPEVAGRGTLVIVGGGFTPRVAEQRFIKSAGGPDAPIVIISTALGDDPPADPGELKMLIRAGAKNLKVLHAHNRKEASDPKFVARLREAKGIWFCGGRQWRLVDSYLGTPAEKAMHEVLENGGVIGGSSAGATIQGDYLVRGNPLGNIEMMAEGYERGFAFLRGVAIDQHFAQRNRFADMSLLKKTFPQVLGLGIDQDAAIIVTGHVMEVVGPTNVQVYDRDKKPPDGEKEFKTVKPGEFYDFSLQQIIRENRGQ